MTDYRTLTCGQLRHCFRQVLIEGLCTQAATDDQHMQWLIGSARSKTRFGGRQPCNICSHRITHPLAFRQRIRETGQHTRCNPAKRFISQPGHRILLMHDQRYTRQTGHDAAGEGDVATHTQHDIRTDILNHLTRSQARTQQGNRQQQLAHDALAT